MIAMLAVLAGAALGSVVRGGKKENVAERARWLSGICRRLLRVIGVRLTTTDAAPGKGAVIVANHLGYLDILVLAAQTPVVFVAKREVRGWPVFGWFAERAGTRFIDRERRGDVVRIAEELGPVLAAGVSVVLFLEGTSSDGREVKAFRASLLEPAVANGWPVVAAGLVYAVPQGRVVEDEVCWWGEMTLAPHLWNLLTLPWIEARLGWGESRSAGRHEDRKMLAAALREEVMRLRAEVSGDSLRQGNKNTEAV